MDRIEQLMKNAKPQIPGPRQQGHPNPDTASADSASSGTVSGEPEPDSHTFSGTFTDSNSVTSLDRARQSKRRTAIRTGVAGLAAAAVVTLAVVAGNLGSINSPAPGPAASNTATDAAPSPSRSASQTATEAATTPASPSASAPQASAPASVPAAAAWQTFASANGKVAFDYPAGWKVVPLSGNGVGNVVKLKVTDSAGKPVADFVYGETGGALGGACSSEPRAYTVLDTVEMQLPYNSGASDVTPRFTYRALETGEGVNASFGITTRKAGADGQSCMFYNVVNGPQESPVFMFADSLQVNSAPAPAGATGVKSFASVAEAQAYMQTSGYLDAKRMITSLKITAG